MGKAFTEEEKVIVKQNIMNAGKNLLGELGYKSTSVDKITEKAGVAKGTFYLFFSSKEVMFFHLMLDEEMVMHQRFMAMLNVSSQENFLSVLKTAITTMFEWLYQEPVLMLTTDHKALFKIMGKLGEEEMLKSVAQDKTRVNDMATMSLLKGYQLGVSETRYFEILRSLAFVFFNQRMIGEEMGDTLAYMVDVLFNDMFVKIDEQ